MCARFICLESFVIFLAACGTDEPATKADLGRALDAAVADSNSIEIVDFTLGDVFGPDRAVWYGAEFLSGAHAGWKRTDCLTCHPYASNDPLPLYRCATCHGGNGACTPNGPSSGKQDHAPADSCTRTGCHETASTHPDNTTYTEDLQCTTCHFAERGGTPDC